MPPTFCFWDMDAGVRATPTQAREGSGPVLGRARRKKGQRRDDRRGAGSANPSRSGRPPPPPSRPWPAKSGAGRPGGSQAPLPCRLSAPAPTCGPGKGRRAGCMAAAAAPPAASAGPRPERALGPTGARPVSPRTALRSFLGSSVIHSVPRDGTRDTSVHNQLPPNPSCAVEPRGPLPTCPEASARSAFLPGPLHLT